MIRCHGTSMRQAIACAKSRRGERERGTWLRYASECPDSSSASCKSLSAFGPIPCSF